MPGSQEPYYDKTKVEDLRERHAKIDFFGMKDIQELKEKSAERDITITDLERKTVVMEQVLRDVFQTKYPEDNLDVVLKECEKFGGQHNQSNIQRARGKEQKIIKVDANDDALEQALSNGYEPIPNMPNNGKIWLRRK